MSIYSEHVLPPLIDLATRGLSEDRQRVVSQAGGRVLEIGWGSGANLDFYLATAAPVIGLEPSTGMLRRFRKRPSPALPLRLLQGDAENLPLADQSIDCALAYLVFCTIPDVVRAAAELHRVLIPGGRLIFFEHVASHDDFILRWQGRLTPLWKRLAGGCHLDRSTPAILEKAGFRFQQRRDYVHSKMTRWFPVCEGIAVKPQPAA